MTVPDPGSTVVRRRVRVTGRVQGVTFRDSTRREAERAGVSGWVANAADGSVVAELEGPPAAVDDVVAWTRSGPPSARVDHVDVGDVAPTGAGSFELR